jgi:hypothetical protein
VSFTRRRVVGLIVVLCLAGCGSKTEKPKAGTPTSTPAGTETPSAPTTPAGPQRRLRVAAVATDNPGKLKFGANARLSGPGTIRVVLGAPPPSATSGKATLTVERVSPRKLMVTAEASGGGRTEASTIALGEPGLKLDRLQYNCQLPPATFCPLRDVRRKGQRATVLTKGGRVPVSLTLFMAREVTDVSGRLAALAPPAPGSPVDATVMVSTLPSKPGEKPAAQKPETTAGDKARVLAVIRPAQGSPAGGSLRIAVPRTSGETIAIQAGGAAGKPASTARIRGAKGKIRILGLSYSCQLPPATFCPLKDLRQTDSGLVMRLPTPRVPVALVLTVAAV